MQVNPQFYAFRWITLLLTQEFNFTDCLHIWDTLLSDPEGPQVLVFNSALSSGPSLAFFFFGWFVVDDKMIDGHFYFELLKSARIYCSCAGNPTPNMLRNVDTRSKTSLGWRFHIKSQVIAKLSAHKHQPSPPCCKQASGCINRISIILYFVF